MIKQRTRRSFRPVAAMMAIGLMSFAAAAGAPPAEAASGGVKVYVGYADNLRAGAQYFPTPWAGSPNVTYYGCDPIPCSYDAGAVMVFNDTPSAVTVDSIVVKVDTCAFDMWPHGIRLAAGAQLIVTQIVSGADNGCTTNGHMDTSDIGPNGAPWADVCTPSGVVPAVIVTVNGSTSTIPDSGRVLNTGGVDAADCALPGRPAGNELTQWTLIGGPPCFAAELGLAPPAQTLHVGTQATVTATLTNDCGQPLPGATVDFAVSSGPNAGLTGSGVTDADGRATFMYTSSTTGTDTVQASVSNLAGTFPSPPPTVAVEWTNTPPNCAAASASVATLWPPNHKLRDVSVIGVTDPDPGDTVSVVVTAISQDEPTNGLGDGDTAPDAALGPGPTSVHVRAERSGTGDGRVYSVAFVATDNHGASCNGAVTVTVPHDQRPGAAAVDSGQLYDSLA